MMHPTTVSWLALARVLWNWSDKLVLTVVIVAPVISYTCLGSRTVHPTRSHEKFPSPGSSAITRTEVVDLWLPETLLNSARCQGDSSVALDYPELRPTCECQGLRTNDLWYAYTLRAYQDDGGAADITFIRHPYCEPEHLQEFHDVLAAAAGISPRHSVLHIAGAEVHILPGELCQRDPRAVIEQLLAQPFVRTELLQKCPRVERPCAPQGGDG
jgi:hypothetical protein